LDDLLWSRERRFSASFPADIDARPFLIGGRPSLLGRRAAGRDGSARPGEPARGEEYRITREELRFFDFETSGLSGGTGTVPFLAAVGRLEGDELLVRQLFLEDYPGEPAYLAALLSELGAEGPLSPTVVVTYNGKAFDLPLLRTRCVVNGLRPPELSDLDALPCSRRLWKRPLGGASLGLVEREVLGRERAEDVPGSAIPGIWFEYLRKGDHPLVGAVMAHNASDITALASVVARIESAFASPRRLAASASIDRAGLGRGLLRLGREEEGEELLEAAAADGDEGAGLLLSRRYRRSGRLEDRGRVLDLLPITFASCVERAKFHEHALRDLEGAREWGMKAAEAARLPVEVEEVRLRLERIERKAARRAGA